MRAGRILFCLCFLVFSAAQVAFCDDRSVCSEIQKGHAEVYQVVMKYGPARQSDALAEVLQGHRDDAEMRSPFWIGYFLAVWETDVAAMKAMGQSDYDAAVGMMDRAFSDFRNFRTVQSQSKVTDSRLMQCLKLKKGFLDELARWDLMAKGP
jgi:hypothetical protein